MIRLDSAGIVAVLNSAEVADAVASVADGVAAEAREAPEVTRNAVPVNVDRYRTDRAAASVTLAHPAGLPIEAKHGTLTRSAGARGLEVRSRS